MLPQLIVNTVRQITAVSTPDADQLETDVKAWFSGLPNVEKPKSFSEWGGWLSRQWWVKILAVFVLGMVVRKFNQSNNALPAEVDEETFNYLKQFDE